MTLHLTKNKASPVSPPSGSHHRTHPTEMEAWHGLPQPAGGRARDWDSDHFQRSGVGAELVMGVTFRVAWRPLSCMCRLQLPQPHRSELPSARGAEIRPCPLCFPFFRISFASEHVECSGQCRVGLCEWLRSISFISKCYLLRVMRASR